MTDYSKFKIKLIEYPTDNDWDRCRERALVTMGKTTFKTPTTFAWKEDMLEARHSPIRCLQFSFYLEVPYWVSVHLCRHIHTQPYVKSQRNDRQYEYDRNSARQDEIVMMRWDLNAESLMTVANKRLCAKASEETRYVVRKMCDCVVERCPEFKKFFVPMCKYHGGVCHEISTCAPTVINTREIKQYNLIDDDCTCRS